MIAAGARTAAAATTARNSILASVLGTCIALSSLNACAATDAKSETKPAAAKGEKMTAGKNPVVVMETSMGTMEIELNQEKAPVSVENFLKYVDSGHYNGTIFHRVIDGFMVQGGGFDTEMKQKSVNAPIKNEAANGLKNLNGTLAMARTNVVDSATAQFFINVKDNSFLDHVDKNNFGYAVFGKVISGMDVVNKIKGVPVTNKGGHENVPSSPVTITSVKRK